MSYQYILLDLDGTLTDPALGITSGIRYALEKSGVQETKYENLVRFIGPTLMESFHAFYGFTEEQGMKACEYFREYYEKQGKFENVVYEGIPEFLGRLKKAGKFLAVVTSKGENFAKDILEHFHLDTYLDVIAGAEVDGMLIKKSYTINCVLEAQGITDLEHTVMVGDRRHDIEAARESGIHNIGVLYGFGSEDELVGAGAEQLAETLTELETILLGK